MYESRETVIATKEKCRNEGGSEQEIAYAGCRSVVVDRKIILGRIAALGDKIPLTPVTAEEIVKLCTVGQQAQDVGLFTWRPTWASIPKRCAGAGADAGRLMDKHSELVLRLVLSILCQT